jgi:hypothetical protein
MVYGCEGNLRANLVAEILEHVTLEVFGIVNCDLLRDSIATDNISLEKLLDGCRGYVGDELGLDPFCKVFHCHNGEGVIPLSTMSMPQRCSRKDGAINFKGCAGALE